MPASKYAFTGKDSSVPGYGSNVYALSYLPSNEVDPGQERDTLADRRPSNISNKTRIGEDNKARKNSNGLKAENGSAKVDKNWQNKDEWNKAEETYRREAEFGFGCCRPRRLQCLAKTLWAFVGLYSPCALWLVIANSFLVTQVVSMERYFNINSSNMGIIMSGNDIGSLVVVLFGSHFGKFRHIPRVLAGSALAVGIVTFSLILVQVTDPVTLPVAISSTVGNTSYTADSQSDQVYLCWSESNSQVDSIGNAQTGGTTASRADAKKGAHWGYYFIIVVLFIVGALQSYRVSLQTAYIEKNVRDKTQSGMLLGVLITAMIFGSPISLLLGGAISSTPVDLTETEMQLSDPRWISAWWLGFVIIGAAAVVTSFPVCFLPRHIIYDKDAEQKSTDCCAGIGKKTRADHKEKQDDIDARNRRLSLKPEPEDSDKLSMTTITFLEQLKEWPRSIKRVLSYPPAVLILVETFLTMSGVSGSMAFQLKYIEEQFDIPASSVSYYLGYAQLATAVLGTFMGGFLITRLKLTTAGMYKLCFGGQFVVSLCTLSILFMACPDHHIVGLDREHSNISLLDCSCSPEQVLFVCGSDGINYLSPCWAGCKESQGLSFQNCLLVGGNGTADPGFCEKDCPMFKAFIAVYIVVVIGATLIVTPKVLMIARSVQQADQALVNGLGSFMFTLGSMVGPIGFGTAYDSACVLWSPGGDTCLMSDKTTLRYRFLGTENIVRGAGLLFLLTATIIVHVQQKRRDALRDQETTVDAEKPGLEKDVKDWPENRNGQSLTDRDSGRKYTDDNVDDKGWDNAGFESDEDPTISSK